jgi:hypothetical protein
MDNETYTCSDHLALQYIIGTITHCLQNTPTSSELSDRLLKAERRKMQLAVDEIQRNWSAKSIGR